jgi:hypothetical protein
VVRYCRLVATAVLWCLLLLLLLLRERLPAAAMCEERGGA